MLYALLTDTETTGLDERSGHVLIELAMRIVVPPDGPGQWPREIARERFLIRPELGWAGDASPFAVDMHKTSGLLAEACEQGRPVAEVDDVVTQFVDDHVPEDEKPLLMGNSVEFDDRFVREYMPRLYKRCHYRLINVTSVPYFIELFTGVSPMDWEKNKAHTADADLDETWNEAKTYAHRFLGAGPSDWDEAAEREALTAAATTKTSE